MYEWKTSIPRTFITVPGLFGPAYIRADLIACVEADDDHNCLIRLERSIKDGPILVKGMSAAAVMDLLLLVQTEKPA